MPKPDSTKPNISQQIRELMLDKEAIERTFHTGDGFPSNTLIAEHFGVSSALVGDIQRRLEKKGHNFPSERIDKRGYTMSIASIGTARNPSPQQQQKRIAAAKKEVQTQLQRTVRSLLRQTPAAEIARALLKECTPDERASVLSVAIEHNLLPSDRRCYALKSGNQFYEPETDEWTETLTSDCQVTLTEAIGLLQRLTLTQPQITLVNCQPEA